MDIQNVIEEENEDLRSSGIVSSKLVFPNDIDSINS